MTASRPAESPAALDERKFTRYRAILGMALPLVLSHLGGLVMQLTDTLFLAHYSTGAVAAVGVSSAYAWIPVGLLAGVTGYAGVFVAQYVGAGQPRRVGRIVWQGLWLSLAGGIALWGLGFASDRMMGWSGHGESLRILEADYFQVFVSFGVVFLANGVLSGFFAGRGDNRALMLVQLGAAGANVLLDWIMIFGAPGVPEMGVAGAALASVLAMGLGCLAMGAVLLAPAHRRRYGTALGWRPDGGLLRRLLRFGGPQGFRVTVEVAAWALFMAFIGQLGADELAASNVALQVNKVAFLPVIGLSVAISMLVGQAQGARRPDLARQAVWRGGLVGQIWMVAGAAAFLLFPGPLMALFFRDGPNADPAETARLVELGGKLLVFVAIYSLLDNFNIVLMGALQGAGDTVWTMAMSMAAHAAYIGLLLAFRVAGLGLLWYWGLATALVMGLAVACLLRFLGGRWRTLRVIEAPPEPGENQGIMENQGIRDSYL